MGKQNDIFAGSWQAIESVKTTQPPPYNLTPSRTMHHPSNHLTQFVLCASNWTAKLWHSQVAMP